MAHLTSRHTQTIYLTSGSSGPPVADTTSTTTHMLQGLTNVKFVLSGIDLGVGIENFKIAFGDGQVQQIEPIINSTTEYFPRKLSVESVDHLYYVRKTDVEDLTAVVTVKYLSGGTTYNKPLSSTYNMIFKHTGVNLIDKNFELLDNQLFTVEGKPIPYFNLESDENIIYPMAFAEILPAPPDVQSIFINTDPETDIDTTEQYLYRTSIKLGQAITSNYGNNSYLGLSALSGAEFRIQGKSGRLFTFVFGISGEQPAKAHELSSRQDVLSAMLGSDTLGFVISDATSLTKPITAQFSNLIGTEFSAINVQDDQIDFEQTNLYPPEATLYTFTTQVSSSVSYNGTVYAGFNINSPYGDFIYSVHEKNISGKAVPGSVVTTGLSSVNRMKTDPDALLIRAL